MKKSLLLLLGAGCWICVSAQTPNSRPIAVKAIGHPKIHSASETGVGSSAFTPSKATHKVKPKTTALTTTVLLGSMYNIIGVSDANTSQLDADQDLNNLITVAHREDMSLPYGSGSYEAVYSGDGGTTWDSATAPVIYQNRTPRYPNGVIINPSGNSTQANAFLAMCGPHTNGTLWDSNAFGSVRLNGTNIDEQMFAQYPGVATESSYTNVIFMEACDDSMVHAIAPAWSLSGAGTGSLYTFYGDQLWSGTWSSTPSPKITWKTSVLRPHFISSQGSGAEFDTTPEYSGTTTAWSQDGNTGYVVFFGNLDSTGYSYASYQPIVYKTTNAGATWTMMPVHNFNNDPVLTKYIRPCQDSTGNIKAPFWNIGGDGYHAGHGVDATVDMNGNLHIFGAIEAAFYSTPDSGGYTFGQANISTMYIYDVYTKTSGGWGATFLDSLAAPFGVEPAASPNYPTPWGYDNGIVWGACIQATRSKDGKKIFCTWLDDLQEDSCTLYPDIFSIGIDVSTGMMTAPVQFTSTANNYFLQVSGKAFPTSCTGGNFWNIPCMIAENAEVTNDGTSPALLYYVQGVGFCDADFTIPTGFAEVASAKAPFSVSPNFPNPFNKQTSFNINLTEASSVAVDVFNTVGQKVWSMDARTMSPGTHMITLDGSSFSAGVYFYRVTANGYAVTNKMIVE